MAGLILGVFTVALGWVTVPPHRKLEVYGDGDDFHAILSPGEKVWLTRYQGEGTWKGWFGGHYIAVSLLDRSPQNPFKIHEPLTEWWVHLKNRAGRYGWILLKRSTPLIGIDRCGAPLPDWAK